MTSEETKKELERIHKLNEPQRYADFKLESKLTVRFLLGIVASFLLFSASRYFKHEQSMTEGKKSLAFQSVTGKIDSSEWNLVESKSRKNLFWTSDYYVVNIKYEYAVGGKPYHGERVSFPDPRFDELTDAQSYASRYKSGDAVQVFYDAADPQVSCLEKGTPAWLSKETIFKLP